MLHGNRPARNDHLALFDGLVDLDMDRGKGGTEGFPKFAEGVGAHDVGAIVGLAVPHGVLGAQVIDGGFAALVPDFVEPLADQVGVSCHVAPLIERVLASQSSNPFWPAFTSAAEAAHGFCETYGAASSRALSKHALKTTSL